MLTLFRFEPIIDTIANNINLEEFSLSPGVTYVTNGSLSRLQKKLERNGSIIYGYSEVLLNFNDIIERNSRNHATCREVCLYLVAIKRFRKSKHLQYLGRDMSTLLAKHLLQTRFDVDAWH